MEEEDFAHLVSKFEIGPAALDQADAQPLGVLGIRFTVIRRHLPTLQDQTVQLPVVLMSAMECIALAQAIESQLLACLPSETLAALKASRSPQ